MMEKSLNPGKGTKDREPRACSVQKRLDSSTLFLPHPASFTTDGVRIGQIRRTERKSRSSRCWA